MAKGYDGSIKISTDIDNDGFKMGKKELENGFANIMRSARGIAVALSGIGTTGSKAFENARLKAKETEIAIEKVKQSMDEVANSSKNMDGTASKAFQTAKIKADALSQSLAELNAQRDMIAEKKIQELVPPGMDASRLSDSFIDKTLSQDTDMKAIDKQIVSAEKKLSTYKAKMEEAKATSKGMAGTASKEYATLEKKLDGLNTKLAQYKMRMEEAKKTNSDFSGVANKARDAFKKTSISANDAGKQVSETSRMIKGMVLSMVLFSSVMLVMQAITEGLANIAQGSVSANATLSQLATNFLYLKNSIASALMPVLQALAPMINFITSNLAGLFNMIGMVTSRVFGGATTFTKAKKANVDYATSLDKTGKSAKKAAKEADNALASFDELNVLQTPKSDEDNTGGGTPGMPAPTDMFETVDIPSETLALADRISELFGQLREAAQPTVDAFLRLGDALGPLKNFVATGLMDFYNYFLKPVGAWVLGEGLPRFIDAVTNGLSKINWDPINNGLRMLWDALAPFAIHIGEGLLWLWETVLVPLETWTINEVVPRFLELLSGAICVVDKIIQAGKPAFLWLWEEFLEPLARWTGGIILDVLDWLNEKLIVFSDWISKNKTLVGDILLVLTSFVAGLVIVKGALMALSIGKAIISGISAAIAVLTSPIGLVVLAIGAVIAIIVLCVKHWDLIKQTAIECWDAICNKMSSIGTWLADNVFIWFTVEKWKEIFSGIGDAFTEKWKELVSWWDESGAKKFIDEHVTKWFTLEHWKGIFAGIKDGIMGIWSDVVDWWDNSFIKQFIDKHIIKWFTKDQWLKNLHGFKVGFVQIAVDAANGMIGAIEKAINWMIEKINTLHWDAPDWVEALGIGDFGFDIKEIKIGRVQMPKLATGAVIPPNAEFMAILGDQKSGVNIESPLSTMVDAFNSALDNRGEPGGTGDVIINVSGNMGQFVRMLKFELDKETNRRGKILIKGAPV